ncbi:hypothetical protein BZG36_04967 [Bifiguratus adelaidae]|uniref:Pentacotripeptide-repeat region of PRORP domain-containing protein n=1 Tax=Bifiguratus adelaidae TaxID=1938954 RepID=A0A261XUM6_9FUNG|nr:hypothetical protein BZG36_04967 [Bifiguratus adelaidae]
MLDIRFLCRHCVRLKTLSDGLLQLWRSHGGVDAGCVLPNGVIPWQRGSRRFEVGVQLRNTHSLIDKVSLATSHVEGSKFGRSIYSPAATVVLPDNVLKNEFDLAIRKRQSERAWGLYSQLRARSHTDMPISIHASMFALLDYVQKDAQDDCVVAKCRMRQKMVLQDSLGTGIDASTFQSLIKPVDRAPHRSLYVAIKQGDLPQAWHEFSALTQQESIPHVTFRVYQNFLHLIRTSRDIDDKLRRQYMSRVAEAMSRQWTRPEAVVTAQDILKITNVAFALRNKNHAQALQAFDALTKDRQIPSALLEDLLRFALLYGQTDFGLAVQQHMQLHDMIPSDDTQNHILRHHLSTGQFEQGLNHFKALVQRGEVPSVNAVNAVMCGLVDRHQIHEAEELFRDMLKGGAKPDVATFSELIKGRSKLNDVNTAMYYFRMMQRMGVAANSFTYNILIDLFAERRQSNHAIRWFRRMLDAGVAPDVVTITSLVKAVSREIRGKRMSNVIDKCLAIYQQAKTAGIDADVTLYSMLIQLHADASDFQGSLNLHSLMVQEHLKPNIHTYNALLTACVNADKMDIAEKMFRHMQQEPSNHPNTVTYTIMIEAYAKARQLHRAEEVFDTFRKACEANDPAVQGAKPTKQTALLLKPDAAILNCLMEAYNRYGEVDKVLRIWNETFDELGVVRDAISLVTVLDACNHGNRFSEGMRIISPFLPSLQQNPQPTSSSTSDTSSDPKSVTETDQIRVKWFPSLEQLNTDLRIPSIGMSDTIYNSYVNMLGMHGEASMLFTVLDQIHISKIKPSGRTLRQVLGYLSQREGGDRMVKNALLLMRQYWPYISISRKEIEDTAWNSLHRG